MRQDLTLLRDRRFGLLLAARTASVLGSAFGPVALAFGVLALPGATATTLSVVVGAESVSMVAFMLIGGVVADRLPRFRVMVGADLAAAVSWGGLAAMLVSGWAPVPLLVAMAALAGAETAFFFPALTGVVPEVVPAERLQTANGLLRLGMNVARIFGFALAGTAVALLGAGWAVAVNAGLLVVSAALTAALRLPTTVRGEPGHLVRDLREGWREFRSRQWLWVVVVQYSFVVMVLQGVWGVLGPVVANARLGGARGWSWVLAAEALGMLAGVVFAIRARPARPIRLVVLVTFLFAGVPLALALNASLVVVAATALVAGVALDVTMVVWETTMQREIPGEMLSRVSSYDALGSLMFGPIGLLLAGPAVVHLGTAPALLASAGIVVLASLGALCSPGVRQLTWARPAPEPMAEPMPAAPSDQAEPALAPLSTAARVT